MGLNHVTQDIRNVFISLNEIQSAPNSPDPPGLWESPGILIHFQILKQGSDPFIFSCHCRDAYLPGLKVLRYDLPTISSAGPRRIFRSGVISPEPLSSWQCPILPYIMDLPAVSASYTSTTMHFISFFLGTEV
jgi:hypothetical protein